MLLTEKLIKLEKYPDRINLSQRVNIECDNCGSHWESALSNREKLLKKYNKDLCRSCKLKYQYALGTRTSHFKEYNISQTGKSFEERLGKEKAKKAKEKMSKKSSGENNAMYGRNDQCHGLKKYNEWCKGKTNEEILGKEKSLAVSRKLSIACAGEKNPMYGKPSPSGSGNGWSGWYKGYHFRSLLELSYIKYLIDNNIKFESAEKKSCAIQYEIDNKKRNYFYDFILTDEDKHIEIKPYSLRESYLNKIKFKAAIEKHGDRFIILTEKDFPQLTNEEIKDMIISNDVKLTDRYMEKFKSKYDII